MVQWYVTSFITGGGLGMDETQVYRFKIMDDTIIPGNSSNFVSGKPGFSKDGVENIF